VFYRAFCEADVCDGIQGQEEDRDDWISSERRAVSQNKLPRAAPISPCDADLALRYLS